MSSGPLYVLGFTNSDDSVEISALESASFADDEAASLSTIQMRIEKAGAYFKILKGSSDSSIVGFVNGTCSTHSTIHHDSMGSHDENGKNLVIHSVTVDQSKRRNGLGRNMLQDYVSLVAKESKHLEMMSLLCKAYLIPFYVSCGFSVVGLSNVEHGKDQWFELHLNLTTYRSVEQIQVDAFATRPFSGNPAAVVFEHRDVEWMQNVAMENNYAETAFLSKVPNVENEYNLRWFTPNKEVDLCGHATLASAHALYETKRVPNRLQRITFHTLYSGTLSAVGKEDGTIELDFPSTKPEKIEFSSEEIEKLCIAFGVKSTDILFTGRSVYDVFVELSSVSFANISTVNYGLLEDFGGRGVIITCEGGVRNGLKAGDSSVPSSSIILNSEYDFVSRCFFPRFSVNEDPVTGSAHCALAPYWFGRFGADSTPKSTLKAYQASSRGGVVHVALRTDINSDTASVVNERVLLSGPAVTTMTTRILV